MRRLFPALLCALALGACSSESDDDGSTGGASAANCGGKGETFTAGMSKLGQNGKLTFVLVSSDPAPPQRYDNLWTIEVKEGDTLLEGATITVSAKMPGHAHAPAQVDITELGAGRYEANPVDLFMIGLWNITITATSAAGTEDSATFAFCI